MISKDLSLSDLTSAHPQTIIKTIAVVGKQVWAIKGKSLLVFESETRALLKETVEPTFGDVRILSAFSLRMETSYHLIQLLIFCIDS